MRFCALLALLLPGATALQVIGFEQRESECAACEIIARVAGDEITKDWPGKLKRDPVARVELLERLCKEVDYAYPRHFSLEEPARKVLRFDALEAGKVNDPNETKVAALENAKHASDLPEKIVRGKERNDELREHCNRVLEEFDDDLAELIKTTEPSGLPKKFCTSTVKVCTAKQLDDIADAIKPPKPKKPEGMLDEDWEKYKDDIFDENGNFREQAPPKKKKRRKKRA
jgi:hypothetical protein